MLSLLLSPLKVTVTLIFVTFFTSLSSVTAIEEDFNDIEFIQKYDEVALKVACEAMSASDPELYKLNLTRPFSYQDVTKLAFLNKGLQLSTRMIEFPDDIAWKRKLVNIMFSIWFNYCPDTYINHNYMKIMRELIMIYINSLEVRSTESVEVWEALTKSLQHCQQSEATVYNFTHIAYMVNGIVVDVPNNNITVKPKPQPPPSPQNGEEDINGTTTGVKGKAGVDEASMLLSGRVDAPGADGSDEGFVTETSGEKIASTESPTDPGDDGGDGGSEPSEPPPPHHQLLQPTPTSPKSISI
ncbi:hypothetical protein Ocin01_11594 [Orchesella cincta]|uniref:Uncharacterized protein n=1 Tax=Orchesella cincta TaxID=48709 RepID=A0A1D2MPU5_ORCCI|nr:hypothetical protein Ocin01_11594 [Orchesella cincta]